VSFSVARFDVAAALHMALGTPMMRSARAAQHPAPTHLRSEWRESVGKDHVFASLLRLVQHVTNHLCGPTCREKIWDHAAGVLIFHEAGGVVTDATGSPLDFSLGRYLDGMRAGIVAAAPSVHKEALRAVAVLNLVQEAEPSEAPVAVGPGVV
jgi:fructose-1,6-bisphosphatase/inositol monophosphatase family enzyme